VTHRETDKTISLTSVVDPVELSVLLGDWNLEESRGEFDLEHKLIWSLR
jgi:hypothetical protein